MNILTTFLKSLALLAAMASVAFAQVPTPKTSPPKPIPGTTSTPRPSPPPPPPIMSPATSSTTTSTSTSAQPSDAEMMKQMMELSKPGENHKILASLAGNWSYNVTMWMAPNAPPTKSTGTAVRKVIMDGRYVSGEYNGKMQMPGADGKPKDMHFIGMSMDGYDNVKKKFVSGWVDNMGTGIMLSEGTYDPATKTLTYTGEYEGVPGMKSKVREVIKLTDATHQTMEYYEDRGQGEMKSMEISYSKTK